MWLRSGTLNLDTSKVLTGFLLKLTQDPCILKWTYWLNILYLPVLEQQ